MGDMDRWNNKRWTFEEAKWPENFLALCREFFVAEGTRKPGCNIYDDVFTTPLFFPLQRKEELRAMMELARAYRPRVVMEIGADKGGGFYHLVNGLQPDVAIACEIRGTPYAELFEAHFPDIQFCWLECGSREEKALHAVQSALNGRTIDVLFIDGEKAATRDDFDAYLPLMSRPGVVFVHDVNGDPPGEAFQDIAKTHDTDVIIDLTDTAEALRRQAMSLPESGTYEQWLRHWYGRSCGVGVVKL